jgi:hypothetical protein
MASLEFSRVGGVPVARVVVDDKKYLGFAGELGARKLINGLR